MGTKYIQGNLVVDNVHISDPDKLSPSEGLEYVLKSNGEYRVKGIGICTDTDIVIPSIYKGRRVTSIGNSAFKDCVNLTSVVISEGITELEDWNTFYGCSSLKTVIINSKITSLINQMFCNCTSLETVVVPDTLTSIEENAFYNCNSFTSIRVPDGVTSIGDNAFVCLGSDAKLRKLSIPNSVVTIGYFIIRDIKGTKVYCEAESKPEGWDDSWCTSDLVTWGATLDNESNLHVNSSSLASVATTDYVNNAILSNLTDVAISGSYNDLTDKPTIPTVPTNVGAFTNDKGYLTEVPSEYVTETELNNKGYLTQHQSLTDYAKKSEIPDALSDLSEDATHRTVTDTEKTSWNAKATTDYVDNKVASLVDSAPGTLDTLNELAAALGDDPNFATTVATEIGKKVDKVSGKDLSTNDFTDQYKSTVDALVGPYSEGLSYTLKDTGEYEVTGIGTCTDTDVVILSIYNGKRVTSIGDRAFDSCGFTSVTIPNSVTTIGYSAFYKCSSLTSITIPDSVTSIGGSAFQNCTSLTSVTIPDSVTSIGNQAFYGCSSLISVTIGDSVTSIGYRAFRDCSNLTSVIIGNSVTSIGESAFQNCSSLIRVTIPNSVTSIEASAFYGCSGLTSITIPDSVTSIGNDAFFNCSSLTNVIIGNNVTTIGGWAFQSCSSLTSITIPDSVTNISTSVFKHCSSLASITIPFVGSRKDDQTSNMNFGYIFGANTYSVNADNVPSSLKTVIISSDAQIRSQAFYGCSNLESIIISESVTSIGYAAFEGCSNVTIYCETESQPEGWNNGWNPDNRPVVWGAALNTVSINDKLANKVDKEEGKGLSTNDLTVALKTNYDAAYTHSTSTHAPTDAQKNVQSDWNQTTTTADDYIKNKPTLGSLAAKSTVTKSDLETSVQTTLKTVDALVGDYSEGLEYTLLSNGTYRVSGIGTCTDTDVVIPAVYNGKRVTSIFEAAFRECSNLTSVTIPDSVTSISNHAFHQCTSLTSVIIPDSVTSIGNHAFSKCSALVNVTVPNSVTSIGNYAFQSCSALTSITIPDSITSIGNYAFDQCTSLTGITIPNSVTSIGEQAFCDCSSLTSITIPDSVTSIGRVAFSHCGNLTSATIPNSVTSMGEGAFQICLNVTIYCEAESQPEGWAASWNGSDRPVVWGASLDFASVNDKLVTIPDRLSELSDDANHRTVTDAEKATWNAKSDFSGSYNDLTNKPTIPTVTNDFTDVYKNTIDAIVGSYSEGLKYTLSDGEYTVSGIGTCTDTDIIIPSIIDGYRVTRIGYAAFSSRTNLKSVTISDSVTTIDGYAFFNCSGLTSVTIPNSVTTIGEWAFCNCTSLTSITIPDSVITVGTNVFDGCPITTATIPTIAIPVIPKSNLTTVVLTSGTAIGDSAFYQCSNLTNITIGNSITTIGNTAFSWCSNLTSVIIPDSVTTIGNTAFSSCQNLTRITIPNSVTTIGDTVFNSCRNLTSVTIPNSVTTIGDFLFSDCDNLIIYCEAESKPDGWNANWNLNGYSVVWGAALDFAAVNNKINECKAYIDEVLGVIENGSY